MRRLQAKTTVLGCALALLASACGIDGGQDGGSAVATQAPITTVATTITELSKPTQAEVAEFLGDHDYRPDLQECLRATAADNTELVMFVALVECDIDAVRVQISETLASTDTGVLELHGLTSDQAAAYYQCGSDNALRFSADRYLTLVARAADLAEFGELLATLAYASCDRLLTTHATLDNAPLTETALQTIIGGREGWTTFNSDSQDMAPGLSAVLVDGGTVVVILTVVDEVGRVPRIDLLFDNKVSDDEAVIRTLDDAASLFDIELDPATSERLRTSNFEVEFRDVVLCSDSYTSETTLIAILPTSAGCDE